MPSTPDFETLTHRLILPRDANHHGTLYAGAMLSLVLEAGYATAYRAVGQSANLVLKRVLDLRCYEPVSIGRVVEIRGREVHRARAQVVVALSGTPLPGRSRSWVDSLMQFVQVNESGRPEPLSVEPEDEAWLDLPPTWSVLRDRARRLLAVRT
jgi:acyl-CoA thioesterase YciA